MLFSFGEIFGGTGVSPVRAQAKACGCLFLVPKLHLGTLLPAKLSLTTIFVPKCNLGTRGKTYPFLLIPR
jgi:hypothetical protein